MPRCPPIVQKLRIQPVIYWFCYHLLRSVWLQLLLVLCFNTLLNCVL